MEEVVPPTPKMEEVVPPTPEMEEVVEEPCVEVRMEGGLWFVASPPLREGENVPEELVSALKVSITINTNTIMIIIAITRMGKV